MNNFWTKNDFFISADGSTNTEITNKKTENLNLYAFNMIGLKLKNL